MPPAAAAVRRVAAPYKMNRHKTPHKPQADNILPTQLNIHQSLYLLWSNKVHPLRYTSCSCAVSSDLSPLFPAPHIKILPDNAADRILFFRNHGACSLSVASGEIYFIDDILPSYIAAEIFETDVPYFLFRRRVVTETAPGDMRSYQNIRHFPQR